MSLTKGFKAGDKVYISGEVKWGDDYYRVASEGVIEEWKKGAYALVTVEYIDGDYGVCTHVLKQDISAIEE